MVMLDKPNSSVSCLHEHRLSPETDTTSSAKIPRL